MGVSFAFVAADAPPLLAIYGPGRAADVTN
jgi:hypothetical protein